MVKRQPKGISLIELLLGIAVMITLGVVSTALFQRFTSGVTRTSEDVDRKGRFLAFSGHLQRFMGTGDSQLVGFSGLPAPQPPLVRFLLPLANRCADFSQACQGDTSYLYVNYQKSTFPAVSAICPLSPTQLLVDLQRTNYGVAQIHPNGFEVVAPAPGDARWPVGVVPVGPNTLMGVVHPPQISLWRTTAAPEKIDITIDPGTGVMTPALPAECVSRLQTAAGQPDVSALYRVGIEPLILTQFTGGSIVTPAQRLQAMGRFPLRVFSTSISTVGRIPAGATNPSELVLRGCTTLGNQVSCGGKVLYQIPNVEQVKIEQFFKVSVGAPSNRHFALVGAPGEASPSCTPPGCLEMPINPLGTIPPILPDETLLTLNPASFSFLKQRVLSRIRFRAAVHERQESFDVAFP